MRERSPRYSAGHKFRKAGVYKRRARALYSNLIEARVHAGDVLLPSAAVAIWLNDAISLMSLVPQFDYLPHYIQQLLRAITQTHATKV